MKTKKFEMKTATTGFKGLIIGFNLAAVGVLLSAAAITAAPLLQEGGRTAELPLDPWAADSPALPPRMELLPAPMPQPQDLMAAQQPADGDDNIEYLMQAPLHEAYAEVPQADPIASPIFRQPPPAPIEEMAPEYRPEGDNVVWIDGYWAWDDNRDDYIWISGVWRELPIGQRWVAGYWHEVDENGSTGYQWVSGFWIAEGIEQISYLPQPPASIEQGPSMPIADDGQYYLPGHWQHHQDRYVWRPGFYTRAIEEMVWVPPTYLWTPCGYVFRAGYWDYPFEQRGVVFAPIHYSQPVYLNPGYFYRPRFIINTGLGLLPHLFIRQQFRHYYFGNFYGNQFVGRGFHPWATHGAWIGSRRYFDPLFSYYNSPWGRYHNQPITHWARLHHQHFALNPQFRPPLSVNVNIINQRINNNNFTQINNINNNRFNINQLPQNQAFLADSVQRRARMERVPGNDLSGAAANNRDRQLGRDFENLRFVRTDQNQEMAQQVARQQTANREISRQRQQLERQFAQSRTAADRSPASLTNQRDNRNADRNPGSRRTIETADSINRGREPAIAGNNRERVNRITIPQLATANNDPGDLNRRQESRNRVERINQIVQQRQTADRGQAAQQRPTNRGGSPTLGDRAQIESALRNQANRNTETARQTSPGQTRSGQTLPGQSAGQNLRETMQRQAVQQQGQTLRGQNVPRQGQTFQGQTGQTLRSQTVPQQGQTLRSQMVPQQSAAENLRRQMQLNGSPTVSGNSFNRNPIQSNPNPAINSRPTQFGRPAGTNTLNRGSNLPNYGGGNLGSNRNPSGSVVPNRGNTINRGGSNLGGGTGSTINRGGSTSNLGGGTINRGGSTSNFGGGSINRGGSTSNFGGGSINRGGSTINRGGSTSNFGGGSVNRGSGAAQSRGNAGANSAGRSSGSAGRGAGGGGRGSSGGGGGRGGRGN